MYHNLLRYEVESLLAKVVVAQQVAVFRRVLDLSSVYFGLNGSSWLSVGGLAQIIKKSDVFYY